MNVLNRSGVFIVGIVLCVLCYVFQESFSEQFWSSISGDVRFWGIMWAFLLGSELYYWKKNDWYL